MKKIIILLAVIILAGGGLVWYFFGQKTEGQLVGNDLIKIVTPKSGEKIISPYIVSGEARGNWFFEASFPVKLLDENGKLLAQTIAQAKSDWMTEDFVPFEAILDFTVNKIQKATLVLQKDNPSGLPENDASISVPVILQPLAQ